MLAGIHFFSGTAVTLNFAPNYYSAFIIGFLLHHFEDLMPHLDLNVFHDEKLKSVGNWNKKIWLLFFGEFLFFLFFSYYFLSKFSFEQQLLALFGGFSALVPDIISYSLNSFFPQVKFLNFYQRFNKKFHFKLKNKNYLLPIIIEILVIIFSIYLFKRAELLV